MWHTKQMHLRMHLCDGCHTVTHSASQTQHTPHLLIKMFSPTESAASDQLGCTPRHLDAFHSHKTRPPLHTADALNQVCPCYQDLTQYIYVWATLVQTSPSTHRTHSCVFWVAVCSFTFTIWFFASSFCVDCPCKREQSTNFT